MNPKEIKEELAAKKADLQKSVDKLNQLKNEKRWTEAWEQLLITLEKSNDTLKYCTTILNRNKKIEPPNEECKGNKIIIDTNNKSIH